MNELQKRILSEGQVLGGGILKVDSFVNHQVDPDESEILAAQAEQQPSAWRI